MGNSLVINVGPHESRVALLENGTVVELYIERKKESGYVGNIYKGKVNRVLPGMQAAFVDIGLDRSAFLHLSDIFVPEEGEFQRFISAKEDELEEEKFELQEENGEEQLPEIPVGKIKLIEELIQEGQDLVVQIVKDPIGTKGCRVTTNISLPGRHLVYMPYIDHVGVSRRIVSDQERARLKELLIKLRGKRDKGGYIVRTMAEGMNEKKIRADMDLLVNLWKEIQEKIETAKSPRLLHNDMDLIRRAVRDIFTSDIDQLIIDDPKEYENIKNFIQLSMPSFKNNVKLYSDAEPIFDAFGVEMEINRALGRKVWLKSGGYIIIDQAEALTAIDVNTGRYVGKHNVEETIFKTNMEAVKEIAYQLRLRNIGGIIIIDFIDMEKEANRLKLYNALEDAFKSDKAKTNIQKISEFGLVEMTRKRIRESLGRTMCEPCFYCDGKGYLKSKTTICYEIFRDIERDMANIKGKVATVNCHPEIHDMIFEEESETIEALERKYKKNISVRGLPHFHIEQYEVIERGSSQPVNRPVKAAPVKS